MEELFDLLEEPDEQKPEQIMFRERLAISLPEQTEQGETGMALTAKPEQSEETVWMEERPEETIGRLSATSGGKTGPGELAELILMAAEEAAIQMSGRSTELMKRNSVHRRFGGEFSGGGWDSQGPEGMEETLPDRLVGAQPWHETVGDRLSGAERLYFGINAPRLRGAEQGERSVVVHLSEPEQRSGGVESMDIRTLDRVFQRDARRYDGGLNLL